MSATKIPARLAPLVAITAVAIAGTGCTSRDASDKPTPRASSTLPSLEPSGEPVDQHMQNYLEAADRANESNANAVVTAKARPSRMQQGSATTTMVIRDEGQEAWKVGTYRLAVYCVGTGSIYAHFKLGATEEIAELPPCSPTITTGVVNVSLTAPATSSQGIIIPVGDAQAAIAYQIQRV